MKPWTPPESPAARPCRLCWPTATCSALIAALTFASWMRESLPLLVVTLVVLAVATGLLLVALRRGEAERGLLEDARVRGERFRLALEAAPNGMMVVVPDGTILMANAAAEAIFGYAPGELAGGPIHRLVPDEKKPSHPHLRRGFFTDPSRRTMGRGRELHGLRKDGTAVPIEVVLHPMTTQEGTFVLAFVTDLSDRKLAARLKEVGRFFEISADLACILSPDDRVLAANRAMVAALPFSMDELIGRHASELGHLTGTGDGDRSASSEPPRSTLADVTEVYRDKQGREVWVRWRTSRDEDGLVFAIGRDITKERASEAALRRALADVEQSQAQLRENLKEREVMLQEIHHRVKNNLQVICSLLSLQSRLLPAGHARDALAECRSRVETIALIHEKLYQSRDYSNVPFWTYARDLAQQVFRASGASQAAVRLEMHIDEIALPVDKAIPCGLILNELIANALKHAFPDRRSGVVRVELGAVGPERLALAVSDDGVGAPLTLDLRTSPSLGMRLVTMLAKQIDGALEIERGAGTTFRVSFPMPGLAGLTRASDPSVSRPALPPPPRQPVDGERALISGPRAGS